MVKFDSALVVKRKLWAEFGKNTPGETCIRDTFQRFCETATVEDREHSGRPSQITEEKIDEVSAVFENQPQSSVRPVARICSTSRTMAHRIMTEHLSLKPYKAQFLQQLYEEDMQDRVEMCKTLTPMLEDNHIQQNLFFSDVVTFYLNGLVNKHNCAMSKNQLVRPYFFEDDTVNGENDLLMLQTFFIPEVKKLHKFRSIIFQQDGAPPHFSIDVRRFLDNHFPDRWIGRGSSIRWGPRSPDLTPLDFFLWVHVKKNVYKTPIKHMAELKMRIDKEIKSIPKETLCNVFSDIAKRMDLCISVDGNHFDICCKPNYMK
ncbi:unnamed protein product [Rotaria sp. Silwood2]|nr:unnamed protein product [Rotaria sp. Silwood2]